MSTTRVPLSVLDLVPVASGSTTREALEASLRLAQVADEHGYHRYWYAEHHNSVAFASSATSLLIGPLMLLLALAYVIPFLGIDFDEHDLSSEIEAHLPPQARQVADAIGHVAADTRKRVSSAVSAVGKRFGRSSG